MAQKESSNERPTFSNVDKARAQEWFKKAADLRERRDYDYAIESYIRGLSYWPEAVEDGHMPLWSLAIQRAQAGGKKPSFFDSAKRSMTGKDAAKAMLNAEQLLAMDPMNYGYAEGVLRNAVKARYLATVKWVAPVVGDLLRKDKKPSKGRFSTFRETLVQAAEVASQWQEGAMETFFLDQALQSLDFAIMRLPGEEELKDEQRDLAGRLTIARGKYEDATDFRDSLQDAEAQKLLHDSERGRQAEDSLEAVLKDARQKYEAAPEVMANLNRLVDLLCRGERKDHEDEAIATLMAAYERSKNYNLKAKADDVRLRQLTRQARELVAKARKTGNDSDRQQARLAAMEQRQVSLDVFAERVAKYPTDLRLKYRYGRALFEAGQYAEAIPMLQEAQADPRSRAGCELLIGRAFFENGAHHQAAAVLAEALDRYELTDDHSKQLLYWLGRAHAADGQVEAAKDAYGKLLRQDYNFMDGDARQRLDDLNKASKG